MTNSAGNAMVKDGASSAWIGTATIRSTGHMMARLKVALAVAAVAGLKTARIGRAMTEPRPQYRTKRDANQADLAADLRALGFLVFDISTLPDARCPGDLLVYGWHGHLERWTWQVFEVKVPGGELTEAQRGFQRERPGAVPVARRAEDVLEWYSRIAE